MKFAIGYLVQLRIPFLMAMGTLRLDTTNKVLWIVERVGMEEGLLVHLLESQIGFVNDQLSDLGSFD